MKVLFDINHIALINFLKPLIKIVAKNGHEVYIIGLNRSILPKVLFKELGEFPIKIFGKWTGNKIGIILFSNIFRSIKIFYYAWKLKPSIGISSGSISLGFPLKLLKIPNIQFGDDPERKFLMKLQILSATERYYPPINKIPLKKNVSIINALKEWSYLSPEYFNPNDSVLNKYKIKKNEYIFIREVSNKSFNYSSQNKNIISAFAKKIPSKYKVLLSLEEKETVHLYPETWILLEEPVEEIHSLIYFSKILISSGDSMAREGALLGVPSIYCGDRTMQVNQILINKKIFFKISPKNIVNKISYIEELNFSLNDQESFRKKLAKEWDDVNLFLFNKLLELSK